MPPAVVPFLQRRSLIILLLAAATALGQQQQQQLDSRIRARAARTPGPITVSLFARNLDTGASYGWNADAKVRTASTIKLPIMVECFRAVADGRAQWSTELLLRDADKVSGSGVLFEFSDNSRIALRDAMRLMIVVSDNTATNLILDKLTANAVNKTMDSLGLTATRSLRKVRGDGSQLKAPSGWSDAGMIEENKKYGIGVSTPREMVTLLEQLEAGKVVNAESSREMLRVLKRQQYRDGIARRLPGDLPVASKTGSLDALRSDVSLVYLPNGGGRIAMAITVDGLPKVDYSADNEGLLLISDLAGILIDSLMKKSR